MEALIALLLIYLVAALIVFPLWAIIKIQRQSSLVDLLTEQIESLRREISRGSTVQDRPAPTAAPSSVQTATLAATPPPVKTSTETPLPAAIAPAPAVPVPAKPPQEPHAPLPPPLPEKPAAEAAPKHEPIESANTPPRSRINWEQFMGVKLFSWLGGFALFLGVAFFVKYSFEHDLIPPEVRVALGFLLSIGLVVGGVVLSRKKYEVTAQTLCASGIVSLYAVTFACRSIYHFSFFGPAPTFGLLVLITTAAFLIAVRLEARVVAVLGMLGGFLTPVLLSTGQDNPLGLFAYIALLDIGVVAVALHRRWHFLIPLGAAGTIIMEIGWAEKFLCNEKVPAAMAACLVFDFLFLAAGIVASRLKQIDNAVRFSLAALVAVSFGFAAYFIGDTSTSQLPLRLFGFVFLADLSLLAMAFLDGKSAKLQLGAGMAVFALLAFWTADALGPQTMAVGLGCYFTFAVIHSAFPLVLSRRHPNAGPTWWSQLFPPLSLLLMLVPILNSTTVSWVVWPAILLVDLLAIVLAWLTVSLVALAAVLVLTLAAAAAWMFHIPADMTATPSFLFVIAGFAVLFFAAGLWFVKRFGDKLAEPGRTFAFGGDFRAQLPAMSALLPFVLLMMAAARLPFPNPTPLFGLALLLVVLALGLSRWLLLEWLPACALVGTFGLAYTWQANQLTAANAGLALGWIVFFHLAFAAFPFLFRLCFSGMRGPWITAAASGVVAFPLVYRQIGCAWPNGIMGVLPLAFAAPPLASLLNVLKKDDPEEPRRLGRLALFGGVALLFITLVFPIQFERQWITISWALEGAALLWLFHRVPHRGLPFAGLLLLVISFVRLANPAVLSYHAHSETPILNWYLYTYGITTACLLFGARLAAPPRDRVGKIPIPSVLNALGVILLFLLVNIEIADFFSPPESYQLTFDFSGNFARDMSYTLAWALYAFGLLIVGVWKRNKGARYAALALLCVTLLKLFVHDLASLGQLYRVAALMAVAVIAILASFIYQRFLPANEKKK
jgi:uncharacterized membrane protein